jgi:hypothetical protein
MVVFYCRVSIRGRLSIRFVPRARLVSATEHYDRGELRPENPTIDVLLMPQEHDSGVNLIRGHGNLQAIIVKQKVLNPRANAQPIH